MPEVNREMSTGFMPTDTSEPLSSQKHRDHIPAASPDTDETWYRALFEKSNAGAALHRIVLNESGEPADYVFLEVNPAFERLTGLKREDIAGKRVTEILPGIETSPFINTYGNVVLTGEPILLEQYSADLGLHYLISAFKTADDQFATIFLDNTKRKKEEEAFRTARDYLDSLLHHASAPVIVWNPDRIVTLFNGACEHLTGYESFEIIGERLDILFPDETKETSLARIERARSGEQWDSVEIPIRQKNGSIRHALWNSANIYENDGSTLKATIAQGIDITERLEAQLQLMKAKEAAECASVAKNQFLAIMSHEMRTPLNGVMGMLELARNTRLNEMQEEYLRYAYQSAEHMLELVENLLDLSRLEAKKLELERSPFSLRDSIAPIIAVHSDNARRKNLDFSYSIEPSIPDFLVGDRLRLNQVIMNLVGNAVKFTEKGSITVNVSANPQMNEAVHLHVTVTDTGCGISPQKQATIFQIFTQADSTSTRKHGGAGIGLAISAALARLMDGDLWVDSTEGRGSVFHFSAILEAATEKPARTGIMAPEKQESATRALRIIVAEDEILNRLYLTLSLGQQGHMVAEAENGSEVIELLQKDPYDLILMDIQMPVMDGIETTRLIREREMRLGGHVHIAAVSAYARSGDRERYLEAGMDDYFAKPINGEELEALLSRVPPGSHGNNGTGQG